MESRALARGMLYRWRARGAAWAGWAYHRIVSKPVIDVGLTEGPVRQEDAAPVSDALTMESLTGMGGECVFLGRTRGETSTELGSLIELEYDAYAPMAISVIEGIARDAARECGCAFIGVRHSIGAVPVGSASVLIRALSAHRNEAFVACRMIIDRLKREAPIWKRERWERGSTWQEGAPAHNARLDRESGANGGTA